MMDLARREKKMDADEKENRFPNHGIAQASTSQICVCQNKRSDSGMIH
jgi:hypothetical protein